VSLHDYIMALDLKLPAREELPKELQEYFAVCDEKLGFVPNVLAAFTNDQAHYGPFVAFYEALMFGESGLTELEREMIAVAVSSSNHCYYCLTAHGASVRQISGDPSLGEVLVMNYRAADLSPRHRAMLDFAVKMTERSHEMDEQDRQALRDVGFGEKDIWDIANVAGFYNMTNRIASAVDMQPNPEYHAMHRGAPDPS